MPPYRRRFFWAKILIEEGVPPARADAVVVRLLAEKGPPPDKLDLLSIPIGGRREYPIAKERSIASVITNHHKHKKARFSTMRLGDGKRATHLEVVRRS